jgi:aminoglycoside phosphotransferase (APT) family kinase protein
MTDSTLGLGPWVAEALHQAVVIRPEYAGAELMDARRLSGGAINQNFLLTLSSPIAGSFQWVMRRSQSQPVPGAHDRRTEFEIFRLADSLCVTVPRPLALVTREGQMASFFACVPGQADARRLISWLTSRTDLAGQVAESLGAELGRLHRGSGCLGPAAPMLTSILGEPPVDGVQASLAGVQESFERLARPVGYLEYAVRSVIVDRPVRPVLRRPSLCHNDFRMGNLMMVVPESTGDITLSAVLDWEFAGWGDPMADIGWLTAPCWRFGGQQPVGGFGALEDFFSGYRRENAEDLPLHELAYWQRLAHVRWAIIAAQQGERVVAGDPEAVELLITGAMMPSIVQPVVEHYLQEKISPLSLPPVSSQMLPADQWLTETARLLKGHLAPGLASDAKYQALMAANAIRLTRAQLRSLPFDVQSESEDMRQALARDLAVWSFTG